MCNFDGVYCTFANAFCNNNGYFEVPYSVYLGLSKAYQEILDDCEYVTIIGGEETCERGEPKYDYCEDGTRVTTDVCIPPDWYDTESNCEECTVAGGRTKICSEATGDLPAGSEIVTHRCVGGRWIEVARCHEDAECFGEGDEKKVTCDDGSEIVTERCVGGKWVETGNTCPDTGGCTSDVTEICSNGSTIVTKRCDAGTLTDTGATCPEKKDTGIIMAIIAGIIGLYLYLRG